MNTKRAVVLALLHGLLARWLIRASGVLFDRLLRGATSEQAYFLLLLSSSGSRFGDKGDACKTTSQTCKQTGRGNERGQTDELRAAAAKISQRAQVRSSKKKENIHFKHRRGVAALFFSLAILLCMVLLRWSETHLAAYEAMAASYYRYTSSSNRKNEAGTNAVTWISTREGLTSKFYQMERLHSQAVSNGKSLRVVDNVSVHYKDMPHGISMCDVFVLPSTISCLALSPNIVVRTQTCRMHTAPANEAKMWVQMRGFGMREANSAFVDRRTPFDFGNNVEKDDHNCLIAFGFYYPLVDTSHVLPIVFQKRYVDMKGEVKRRLGLHQDDNNYVLAHWRRGDQKSKCAMTNKEQGPLLARDESVNCLSADEFIEAVFASVAFTTTTTTTSVPLPSSAAPLDVLNEIEDALPPERVVYVATNEKDPKALAALTRAGFLLYRDVAAPSPSKTSFSYNDRHALLPSSSLDVFVVELQMMIEAKYFIGWGSTGIHEFVDRARRDVKQRT